MLQVSVFQLLNICNYLWFSKKPKRYTLKADLNVAELVYLEVALTEKKKTTKIVCLFLNKMLFCKKNYSSKREKCFFFNISLNAIALYFILFYLILGFFK